MGFLIRKHHLTVSPHPIPVGLNIISGAGNKSKVIDVFLSALLERETTQNVTTVDSQRCHTASYCKAAYGVYGGCTIPIPTIASQLQTPFAYPLWVVNDRGSSDKELDPLADGLSADRAGLERGTAVDAGGVSTLEDQLDVVVNADGAGDPLLHLPVARLQLFQ